MRRKLAIAALLLLMSSGAGCGKYGKPVRIAPRPPAAAAGAQPSATASTPDGEACEEEEPKAETPAP